MSIIRLIFASFRFHWRTNLAVACGVAVGAAVLTGALLVGDSMHGSLRHLTLDRLGRIDEALVADHFFRAALADELANSPNSVKGDSPIFADTKIGTVPEAAPVILLQVNLENADPQSPARANRVELIGCDTRFWHLGSGSPRQLPQPREIVLNRPLAERLQVGVGDTVLLRMPRPSAIPADSALGKKQETIRTQRLTVSEIIAAEGVGRFGLRPTQHLPQNAYVPLNWLQDRLEQPGRANAIFVAGSGDRLTACKIAPDKAQWTDYGLNVERTTRGYWNITSDRMLIEPAVERAIIGMKPQPALTYLANTLASNGREIPYSTVTAIEFADRPPLGPFVSGDGKALPPLGPNEIALNAWAAEQLHAKVGDAVQLSYFEPESIDGQVRERTISLRLAAVVQISGAADDRALTPSVKGITDELTMAEWDPPFPFDAKRVRPVDEKYWDRYGTTPKAFVSLSTGRKLWGSRFGETTSIRVAEASSDGGKPHTIGDWSRLLQRTIDPATMGLVFQPIKLQGLAASAGTTPFGVLFLCFSFFIIAAAVMLVAILFRLGVERRATEMGTLLAVGLSRRQVGRLLLGEGLAVAAVGSLAGMPLGIGYAALLLLGLRTWWLAAVATPFLRLYVTPASLAIGCLSGLAIAAAVIWLSVRQMARTPPRRLLAGQTTAGTGSFFGGKTHLARSGALGGQSHFRGEKVAAASNIFRAAKIGTVPWSVWLIELALIVVALAPSLALLLGRLDDAARAGAFFASGAIALLALLLLTWMRLKAGTTCLAVTVGRRNLIRMALRNAARNPGRSTLTEGLVAAATYLIVAVSAFRLDPSQQTPALDSGNGGFALVAESDQPIFLNLNTPEGRKELGFSPQDEEAMTGSTIVSLRVRAGDDASCLNLYRPQQPRVLGVPLTLVEHDGFAWANKPRDTVNPWLLLTQEELGSQPDLIGPVPVILEKNTANYSLNLWGGLGETFEIADENGRPLRLRVVALLADSIFQGELLIGQRAFLKHFPNTSGYRLFLVETPPPRTAAVHKALERNLCDYGLAIETTGWRLADFLAVQNTYLSTFQSLGGLGLLLGTLGLAAVQVRSVVERRGELALLRAAGFRRSMLARLVLLEHAVLLVAGLGIGLTAAVLAVLPHLLERGAPLPWASLTATLAAVLVLGLAAGGFGVRAALRAPLILSLREENR